MFSFLVAALLAQAPDAGVPDAGPADLLSVDQLYTACGDAPVMTFDADAGNFIVPLRRQQRNNCKLAACEEFATAKLKEDSGPAYPGTALALVAGGVALMAISVAIGYLIPHPNPK